MSVLRAAIRACAVAALRDKTWAEERCFDSDMTALADAVFGGPPKPYIVVYTDTDNMTPSGAMMYDGDARRLNVVLEIGVANAVKGESNNVILQFAQTDQGMELAVDMVASQCMSALWGDPQSQWGEIFKQLCYRCLSVNTMRGGQAQAGVRFAARRVTFVVNTIYDIPPGVVPDPNNPIMQFINLAKGNPSFGVTDVGSILASMLATTAAPSWRQVQAYLGLSQASVEAFQAPGLPLPYANVETPPLDSSDSNEYVPPLVNIQLADEETNQSEPELPLWPPPAYLDNLTAERIVNEPPGS